MGIRQVNISYHAIIRIQERLKTDAEHIQSVLENYKAIRLTYKNDKSNRHKNDNSNRRVGYLIYDKDEDAFFVLVFDELDRCLITVLTLEQSKTSSWSDNITPKKLASAIRMFNDNADKTEQVSIIPCLSRHMPLESIQNSGIKIFLRYSKDDQYWHSFSKKCSISNSLFKTNEFCHIVIDWASVDIKNEILRMTQLLNAKGISNDQIKQVGFNLNDYGILIHPDYD